MQYEILKSASSEKLVKQLNIKIQEGWEPIGSLVINAGYTMRFYQAIIKRETKGIKL